MAPFDYSLAIKVLEVIKRIVWLERKTNIIHYTTFFNEYGLTPNQVKDSLNILKAHGVIKNYSTENSLGESYVIDSGQYQGMADYFIDKIYKLTSFHKETGVLSIFGSNIKFKDDQRDLLEAIFDDTSVPMFTYLEIASKTKHSGKNFQKKYKNAAEKIRTALKAETSISDFFITIGSNKFELNPKYLA